VTSESHRCEDIVSKASRASSSLTSSIEPVMELARVVHKPPWSILVDDARQPVGSGDVGAAPSRR